MDADVDCMVAQVISFGTSPGAYAARQDIRKRLMEIMKSAWYPSQDGPPGNLSESLTWTEQNSVDFFQNLDKHKEFISTDDLAWLTDKSPFGAGLSAPQDYLIKLSERVKHLERPDFWLGENDTDWHIPILLTIREHAYRNWRKRSTEKVTAREEKKSKTSSEKKTTPSTGGSQGYGRSWSSQSWSSQTWSSHQSWSTW